MSFLLLQDGNRLLLQDGSGSLLLQAGSSADNTAAVAATIGAVTSSASATFTKPTYTAAVAASVGSVTASVSATFTKPTYAAAVAATVGATTASASATFETILVTATVGAATASASATFTKPTYSGTVTATIGAVTAQALESLPIVTDFSGTPLSGNTPLAVQFTDSSTGDPTSWLWDFGDGNTSVEQNPLHIYSTAGTWSVSLTASNAYHSDELIRTNYIVSSSPATNRVGGGGQGGGPILGYQMVEIDFDSDVERAKFETEQLQMKEKSLLLALKIRRQREENELLHLDVL